MVGSGKPLLHAGSSSGRCAVHIITLQRSQNQWVYFDKALFRIEGYIVRESELTSIHPWSSPSRT
ncbi:hypothetical protein E1956_42595 (plasmid) [Paraburkholderia pallida]|uniref:Uncharacterized protein n=1 Tax=Paraburkholderia pallida TaxID=2547399 RepID=A0A4P7D563_9BURK|nr:hypothetical protein E1956_42595 [Paraburkholderia pallida]